MDIRKPELFVNKEDCCGCSACEAVCPMQCITMISDDQGFFYPCADDLKCIGCFKCIEVCPLKQKR